MKKHILVIFTIIAAGLQGFGKNDTPSDSLSYCWRIIQPLGLRERVPMDTLLHNYYQTAVPSVVSPAFATTGNQVSVGKNMIYMESQPMSDFFFRDAKQFWMPTIENMRFFNSRIPITQLGYNTGGGREIAQDYLRMLFSGNVNKRTQIGARLHYPYSKGSYEYQAAKGFSWGLSASYMGDRYELQTFFNTYNFLNKENGGITDDLYITDPAEVQGGLSTINPKNIPTRLSNAHSRVRGQQFYMNHRYKVGYWKETRDETDSVIAREYIPVSSFIWTLDYKDSRHRFTNTNASQGKEFWTNHYLDANSTCDYNHYNSLRNTVGISLLEGFNKYAKAGLTAFASYKISKYTLMNMNGSPSPDKYNENEIFVGGELSKREGNVLHYHAIGEVGLAGKAIGQFDVKGDIDLNFPLWKDTVSLIARGEVSNKLAPFYMRHYHSKHFLWDNDMDKEFRTRIEGELSIARWRTRLKAGVENIKNYTYFNQQATPEQKSGSLQVLSASLNQDFKLGIFHLDNKMIWQKSSDQTVLPLPDLSLYHNFYMQFKLAKKVLSVQLGADVRYFTKYNAPAYTPAIQNFHLQSANDQVKIGGYPIVNVYANLHLKRTRFYVMMYHVNQGVSRPNYFLSPHYPINPRFLKFGLSWNFYD